MRRYNIIYSVWHDKAGCLARRDVTVLAPNKRDAWMGLRTELEQEFERDFLCGHMRYRKENIIYLRKGN